MQSTTIEPSSRAGDGAAPNDAAAALRTHVREKLSGPLAAVRAALEADRTRSNVADLALTELVGLERAVRDLVAHCLERPLRVTRTTLGEVGRCLRSRLENGERSRLWITLDDEAAEVFVDGAELVDALERLARTSLVERGGEVLFHAHADDGHATFSLVDDPGQEVDPGEPEFEGAPDLALQLAERFAERSGGTCNVHWTAPEHRCVILRVPRGEVRS